MAQTTTCYAEDTSKKMYYHKVTFFVKTTGAKITKSFASEYHAKKFANKLKHSESCVLISCEGFI